MDIKNYFLPAILSTLAPWQEKITNISLISNYYQPQINITASVASAITAMAMAAYIKNRTKSTAIWWIVFSSSICVILLITNYLLIKNVDIVWVPSENLTVMLRVLWPTSFLFIFIFLSLAIAASNKYFPQK